MTYDFSTVSAVQSIADETPLHRWLGFRIDALDAASGALTLVFPARGNAARTANAGQAHGGALATAIDSAAALACSAMLGRPVATVSLSVDYLRPAGGDAVEVRATVRRAGRSIAVVDVEVMAEGRLVALGRCTLATGG